MTADLLVTGATGYVGGAALRLLAAAQPPSRLAALVRSSTKAGALPAGVGVRVADYDDPASLEQAFRGVTKLLFVASDGAARDVMRQHANVIDAAAAAGVEDIVFTSIIDVDPASPFYFAPVYRDAERRLVECGVPCTILRCGLYADFLHSHWLAPARTSGVIEVPAGPSQVAPVARDDIAAAAAAVIASGAHRGAVHALSGPRAYGFDRIAALASEAFGVPITYRPCSPTDYLQRCWATLDDPWPHAFSTLFVSIAQDRYASPSSAIEALTGREPTDLETFLAQRTPGAG